MTTRNSEPMTILHMKLPAELKHALEEIAQRERRTLSATVIVALEQWLEGQKTEKKRKS